MKEFAKRLISLIGCLAFIVTLAPAVMASDADIAALTLEDIVGHQPANMITQNLTLPEGYTWTVRPEGVIDTETGTVTRQALEDTAVTLTATVAENVSESFNLVVKAKVINILAADTFAYDYAASANAIAQEDFIFRTYQNSDDVFHPIEVSDGNSYLKLNWPAVSANGNNYKRAYLRNSLSEEEGVLYFSFKYKYSGSSRAYVFLNVGGADQVAAAIGMSTNNDVTAFRFTAPWEYSPGYIYSEYAHDGTDDWKLAVLKYDVGAGTIAISDDGTTFKTAQSIVTFAEGADKTVSNIKIGPASASPDCGQFMIDDFAVYTESSPEVFINTENANEIAALITAEAISGDASYSVENNLSLSAPFTDINLEEMGVSVKWISSDTSVIANDGTVTRQAENRYVVMTGVVTAGTGDNAVTVTKDVPLTVPAVNSSVFSTYNYSFESDTIAEAPKGWSGDTASTAVTASYPDRSGNVLQADFTGSGYVATVKENNSKLTNRYFISADVCFEPDDTSSQAYFYLNGAAHVVRVGFNFQKNAVMMYGDSEEREYVVPGVEVKTGEWYHFDIDVNSAKKNAMAYINGQAITAEPLDIPELIWTGGSHIRQVGIYLGGAGTGYLDNVIIRESNLPAPVYDENSDYTVKSIAFTNQKGKTITNVTSDTTKVIAKVKLIQNRTPVDGEGKILFARYDEKGRLVKLIPEIITTTNSGAVITVEMPLEGDCTGHTFKIFVIDSDSLIPISSNYSSVAPKFDTARLFDKTTNVEDALELGYEVESGYDGIDAIIFDGDVYKGRKARHFAYIGLPEGASSENPVPAVVCVHGGGGTAYAQWVKKWNDEGYAAIAMDLNGRIPQGSNKPRHKWAGASSDNYGTISPDDEAWMYSAVTAVIGAHNVLREMPEIDNSKIGIVGVSWGGVVTSTAIGVDDRFAFAIPSYGCGYLYGSETYMADLMTEEKKLWDPSSFIGNAQLPVLWMNGDGDGNFSLTSTTKSALLAGDNSYVSIIPDFNHSHTDTWNRPECYAFADSIVNSGTEFIKGSVTVEGSVLTVKTSRAAKSAAMYYTTSDTLSYDEGTGRVPQFDFSKVSNDAADTDTFTFTIPSDAKKFYIVFKDENNYNTSTVLYDITAN